MTQKQIAQFREALTRVAAITDETPVTEYEQLAAELEAEQEDADEND